MNPSMLIARVLLPAALVIPSGVLSGQTIATGPLIEEMVSLEGMAEFPSPPYTCKQFSSYDPASKSPAENWFANGDVGHYLRVEDRAGRREHVMMDATGPGAIVRIWSANPAGVLRIYVDGAETPVIEAPMDGLLGGKFPGLPRPIAGEYSKGWNLYLPIPYARSCKVTSDQGGFYYHVNYRTYPAGTAVESFTAHTIKALSARLEKLAAQLADPRATGAPAGGRVEVEECALAAGESVEFPIDGPAAITRAVARVKAADLEAALRGVILEVSFDGRTTVAAPLGDFFGSAPGVNPFAALPCGVAKTGEMYSHWYMPFQHHARITLRNTSSQEVAIRGEVTVGEHRWTDRSMYFHAKWRAQCGVPTRPMIDWNYLTATGRGVFAGVAFAIDNPVKDWWGEGDEKIYVDGEKFPSHFGTGTEDYYGYAWCFPGLFTHAYHAQPRCDGPGNYGRTSVNRFHILDRIPFTKDFRFDMELWHWHPNCSVNLAVTAYWYAMAGATDTFAPITPAMAVVKPMPEYQVPRVAGAIEGETLKIVKVTGTAAPQDWDGLSAGRHLWWHGGIQTGSTLSVAFPAPKAGSYQVLGRFLRAKDYGIHQLAINGRNCGAAIDFYHPDVKPTGEIDLGVHELKAGDNEFRATATGANANAVPSLMFGLDYLLLKPVKRSSPGKPPTVGAISRPGRLFPWN